MRRLDRTAAEAPDVYNERPSPYTCHDNTERDLRPHQAQLLAHFRDGAPGARSREPSGGAQVTLEARVGRSSDNPWSVRTLEPT